MRNAPTKTRRGVRARIRRQHAMKSSNNSAQCCLGVVTKVDRGVVTGRGEIKILQGGIPSPQTQFRAHAMNTQAKMRGVNSALLRSHCKGGELKTCIPTGSRHANTHTQHNMHSTHPHTQTHMLASARTSAPTHPLRCSLLLAFVICFFKFSHTSSSSSVPHSSLVSVVCLSLPHAILSLLPSLLPHLLSFAFRFSSRTSSPSLSSTFLMTLPTLFSSMGVNTRHKETIGSNVRKNGSYFWAKLSAPH